MPNNLKTGIMRNFISLKQVFTQTTRWQALIIDICIKRKNI